MLLKYMVAMPAATLGAMKEVWAPRAWLTRLLRRRRGVAQRERPSRGPEGELPATPAAEWPLLATPPTPLWLDRCVSIMRAVCEPSETTETCRASSVCTSLCPRDRQLFPCGDLLATEQIKSRASCMQS